MPIVIAPQDVELTIVKILISDDKTKKHLESLGIIPTGKIRVVSVNGGNAIVVVKGVRLGLNRDIATKILVA
ncbi:MAG: ferrous iron transport protein A [Erysipelotrichaceae bacterium]|jgi:ferrous iron transport protein A|nr:ferrous iron transport protein A [Erysipelotrichaceae bacterium]